MKKLGFKISNSFEEALKNRNKPGFRYDNTDYWKSYYKDKLIQKDVFREKRYADYLYSLFNSNGVPTLDVATGYGFLPLELQKAGFSVTCTDLFDEMFQLASKYFADNKQEFSFSKADIAQLPFKKNSFKLVTAMSILEHFPKVEIKDMILPELSRVLERDGYLFVHAPVKSVATRIKKMLRRYVENDLSDWACDDDNDVTHKIWFSVREYRKILEKSGFKVEYYAINFVRSNEKLKIIKYLSSLVQKNCSDFYPVGDKVKLSLLSQVATSVALVCKKA